MLTQGLPKSSGGDKALANQDWEEVTSSTSRPGPLQTV